jgi:hypothetical protein
LNFTLEFHRIALKIRVNVKKSPVHAAIGNSRRRSVPLGGWSKLALQNCSGSAPGARMDWRTGLPSGSKELTD